MVFNLFKRNWKTSPAHLLLLCKFLSPHQVSDFTVKDYWKEVLNEDTKKAIDRFLKEKYLVQGDISSCLDYKFKISELKVLLKKRDLKVSGKKDELIERLVNSDLRGMQKEIGNLKVYTCSETGKHLAEEYLESEKQKRLEAERTTIDYLKKRDFKQASRTVANYESKQVFSRGMGIDWKNYSTATNEKELTTIFSQLPKLVSGISSEKIETLQVASALMYLWGVNGARSRGWIPDDFETGIRLDSDTVARMIWFHANGKFNLEQYRESGFIKTVKILPANDSCPECKKLASKKYSLSNPPELPYEKCTSEMGCRCCYITE